MLKTDSGSPIFLNGMTSIARFFDTRSELKAELIRLLGGGNPARWHEVAVKLSTLPDLRAPKIIVTGTVISNIEANSQTGPQRAREFISWIESVGVIKLEHLIWALDAACFGRIAGEIQAELDKAGAMPEVGRYTIDTIGMLQITLKPAVSRIVSYLVREGVMHKDTILKDNDSDALTLAEWVLRYQNDPKIWDAFVRAQRAAGIDD